MNSNLKRCTKKSIQEGFNSLMLVSRTFIQVRRGARKILVYTIFPVKYLSF